MLKGFIMTPTENITTMPPAPDGKSGCIDTASAMQMSESTMRNPTDVEVSSGWVPSRHNCKRCHRLLSLYPERLSTCFRLVNGFFSESKF